MLFAAEMPYRFDALEPVLSDATVRFHRRKQERYAQKTADLVRNTPLEHKTLGEIVRESERMIALDPQPTAWIRTVFEQSSQAWNHALMWLSMAPTRVGHVRPWWVQSLRAEWKQAAKDVFGSGWVWLVLSPEGRALVESTPDAQRPRRGRPLAVMDVWEHAYYLDFPDAKDAYVDAWWDRLADWELATRVMEGDVDFCPGALR